MSPKDRVARAEPVGRARELAPGALGSALGREAIRPPAHPPAALAAGGTR